MRSWIALVACALMPALSRAEQVRFRYVPADANGAMRAQPIGPGGSLAENLRGLSYAAYPFNKVYRPTHMVTFLHPSSGRNAVIPLTMPESEPTVQRRGSAIAYNYGIYEIELLFLPNGAVDVIYNSGYLRPLPIPGIEPR
ncbi:MAG: hypothetical protein K2X38_10395 [Gemmataceae bacterium]|nr:hypothetical protein [Gemmataceae bacterium]